MRNTTLIVLFSMSPCTRSLPLGLGSFVCTPGAAGPTGLQYETYEVAVVSPATSSRNNVDVSSLRWCWSRRLLQRALFYKTAAALVVC